MCCAIIRFNRKAKYIAVLCPIGHLIESHKLDEAFAGSAIAAELARRRDGDRFDRLAARCGGTGHEPSLIGRNRGPVL